jgi:hypothetical protein
LATEQELEEVSPEAQETILKFIRFLKNEFLVFPKIKRREKKINTLTDVDKIAIENRDY